MATQVVTPDIFQSFGDLLKYLRRRKRMTQVELSIHVGYSIAQISRLEQNQRLPDLTVIKALFVPALQLEYEPDFVARLIDLAQSARQEDAPEPGTAPYMGLLFFDQGDAERFFGREALTDHLANRVKQISNRDRLRFLAVIGASGSGKSSLVRAGLAQSLECAGWKITIFTPTAAPMKLLAEQYQAVHFPNNQNHLLIVDQFEETFTLCRDESERRAFIERLLSIAAEPSLKTTVVIALRADFYSHCAQYPLLREAVAGEQEYIGPMTIEALRCAIEEPAKRAGWELEPGLVDTFLRDISSDGSGGLEPGGLPLLSHALLATWERRRGRTLTHAGYRAAGGVRGAIAETAESVFTDQLDQTQQDLARNIFLRLTELGEGTEDTRRRAGLDELLRQPEEADRLRDVLNQLANARLITINQDSAEVAHEAIIREWQRLREWLEQDRENLHLHRHLTMAALAWQALDRDSGELYRGARLAQALEWASSHEDEMNALEREFLLESIAASEREASEREAMRQRELDAAKKLADSEKQAAARLRVRHWVITGVGIIAVLLAVLAGAFAVDSNRNAHKAQADAVHANAQYLAEEANSLNLNNGDPNLTALLAIRSLTQLYTPSGDSVLTSLMTKEAPPREFKGHSAEIFCVAFSPDGKYLATASGDQTVLLWDVSTGKTLRVFKGHDIDVEGLAFSSDGKTLVTISHDTTIRFWDVASGKNLKILQAPSGLATLNNSIYSVAYSPDSRFIATAGVDNTARIWDVETGQIVHELTGHTQNLSQVAYSPDGKYILTSSHDGTARLWDSSTGENVSVFKGTASDIKAVAFTPDGKYIATGNDYAIWLWDIATHVDQHRFAGHDRGSEVTGIAFSPDGKTMASIGTDGTARLWDVASGNLIRMIGGRGSNLMSVKFSPDGKLLATAGLDKVARVWGLQTSPARMEFNQGAAVRKASFSPDGRWIATASYDNKARIWDVVTAQTHLTLTGHTGEVTDVEFSPDGKTVVTASADKTARLWNADTGKELRTFQGLTGKLEQAAISPDGKTLLTTGDDGTAQLWDLKTGKTLMTYTNQSPGQLISTAFSPDGKTIATSGAGDTARIWDAQTGKDIMVFKGHTDIVTGIAFSPDGKYLLTSSWDGTSRLWEVSSGREIRRFTGHTDKVSGAAFSPDGKTVLTSSVDQTARLWDVETGQEVRLFSGHTGEVRYVAFSPDGRSILTSSTDGSARLWLVNLQDTIRAICASLTRDMTPEERTQYGITDQTPTCTTR